MKCPITGTAASRISIKMIASTAILFCMTAIAEVPTSLRHEATGTTLSSVLTDGTIVLGISASGLRGISASGLRGISASGLRGISASGLRGISASGLRGISASGLRGISASGLRGISASGLRGISASGLRGISASGLRGISASGLRAEYPANDNIAFQFEDLPLVAIGTASAISSENNFLLVLGQEIAIDEQTLIIAIDENIGLPTASIGTIGLNLLQEGDYVAIAGEYMSLGRQLGTVIIKVPRKFEAGNSITYLRSKFSQNTDTPANATSGNSSIDYSNALYNSDIAYTSSDDAIEYFGFTTMQNPNKLIATFGNVVNENFPD